MTRVPMTSGQLQFDFDALTRLVDRLRDRRRVDAGADRLLVALVRRGLAERDLIPAAALVLELDQQHNGREARKERDR